jgi:hypothetical protein
MDTAEYLGDLARNLARSAIASSELVALVFEANGLDVQVNTKRKAHPSSYPALGDMLGVIGSHCVAEGITVSQLRRIAFADQHVTVEFAGQGQGQGQGQGPRLETREYSIKAVLRPATPRGAYGAMREDGTASRSTAGSAGREEGRAGGKPSQI